MPKKRARIGVGDLGHFMPPEWVKAGYISKIKGFRALETILMYFLGIIYPRNHLPD